MNWLLNAKMVYKLGVLVLIALVALGAVGYTGYYYLHQANKSMDNLYDNRLIPVKLLNDTRANANATDGAVLELMLATDAKKNQELTNEIASLSKKNNENLAIIEKLPLDAKATELLGKVKAAQQNNRAVRIQVPARNLLPVRSSPPKLPPKSQPQLVKSQTEQKNKQKLLTILPLL